MTIKAEILFVNYSKILSSFKVLVREMTPMKTEYFFTMTPVNTQHVFGLNIVFVFGNLVN